MLTILPSDIPNFEGNPREDATNHVRSFHMGCSSNSIAEDSIRLHLFQCTLNGATTKWYVNQPRATHSTFSTLSKAFLAYFQLSLHYDTCTELLTSFLQTSATRLSGHF